MSKETVIEDIQIDEKAMGQIVDAVKESMKDGVHEDIEETVKSAVESVLEEKSEEVIAKYLEKTEEIEKKAVEKHLKEAAKDDPIAQGIEKGDFSEEIAKMSPEMRFYKAIRAMDDESGDAAELRQLNKYALASQLKKRAELLKEKGIEAVRKAGYANEGVAADGGVLIPDAEFVTTVFDNLPTYGVAFRYADVRQTDRTSVRVLSLDSGLTFYATAEAGVKTGAKLAFAKNEVSLQKFAVIVPSTDELTDDAAIDYWALVTRELTRAYAKKADELVFTDTTYGITNLSGVTTHTMGADDGVIVWGDLLAAEAKLEDDLDVSNYRWYMRKETWYSLVQQVGSTNDHYIAGSLNTATGWVANINQPTTPWGTPVVFTRVLPTIASVSDNDAVAVFGDLRNTMLYNKRGMAVKMLTEATVVGSDGSDLNLATQDASAMRAVIRMLHICPKANRPKFCIIGPGTVS